MTNILRVRIHLLGGQTMETVFDCSDEPEDYAGNLAVRLTNLERQFISIGEIGFFTGAVAGFDVDGI